MVCNEKSRKKDKKSMREYKKGKLPSEKAKRR
jgi:hypothetical protein